MVFRFTVKDAEKALRRLARMKGKRIAQKYNDVGAWRLDYNPIYGGVVVEEIVNRAGGVTQPLGASRMSPREFVDFVHRTVRFRGISSRPKTSRVRRPAKRRKKKSKKRRN